MSLFAMADLHLSSDGAKSMEIFGARWKDGAPPHGGSGMGLDRLAMVMSGADSLRDVVAFPKVQNASELMSQCPTPVSDADLAVLGIAVTERDETEK